MIHGASAHAARAGTTARAEKRLAVAALGGGLDAVGKTGAPGLDGTLARAVLGDVLIVDEQHAGVIVQVARQRLAPGVDLLVIDRRDDLVREPSPVERDVEAAGADDHEPVVAVGVRPDLPATMHEVPGSADVHPRRDRGRLLDLEVV